MHIIIATLVSMLPRVFMFLLSKLVTETFLQIIVGRVVIAGLGYLARMTATKVDDKLVQDMETMIFPPKDNAPTDEVL